MKILGDLVILSAFAWFPAMVWWSGRRKPVKAR